MLGLACLSIAGVSCHRHSNHKPVFPVTGQVLLNGQPARHVFVVFHPVGADEAEGIRPRAHAKEDGTFQVTTYGRDDGAPAGEYALTVELFRAPTANDDRPPTNILPGRYANPKTSGLSVRVDEGPNELPPLRLAR
jgi:hypothetical protein